MLKPDLEIILNGYFEPLFKATAEMWTTVKAMEILARKQYGDKAFEEAIQHANRTRPSWTTLYPS